jgi:hypothetical protein
MPQEPRRQTDLDTLQSYVADRVREVITAMQAAGFDPIVFEARRELARQKWLYGVGRTHDKNRKPVTWTMNSLHIPGKAADIISKRRGWNWPEFYVALHAAAHKVGLHTIAQEGCHIEWQG